MRQIKASEVKTGMEVEFTRAGVRYLLTPNRIVTHRSKTTTLGPGIGEITGYHFCAEDGGSEWVSPNQEVTVLSEPAPAQPEEPTEFGAKVRVHNGQYVRLEEAGFLFRLWYEMGTGRRLTWEELCEMGPVQVIPDQGWTVPDTPEVPERIEEWPEDDEHLKDHKWRDEMGAIWSSWSGKWGYQVCGGGWRPLLDLTRPFGGPWTRESDA